MRNDFKFAVVAVLSLAVISIAGQQRPSTQVSNAPYRPPRMADGHPDLNGIWQALVSANWDLQDHEAQPGPHPEIMGAYGGGLAAITSALWGCKTLFHASATAK